MESNDDQRTADHEKKEEATTKMERPGIDDYKYTQRGKYHARHTQGHTAEQGPGQRIW